MNVDNAKDPYIMVYQFMCEEMGLKGGELLIYALIYGYSVSGNGVYKGNVAQICRRTGLKERSAHECLTSLVAKGYITKEKTPIMTPNIYRINLRRVPGNRVKIHDKDGCIGSNRYKFDVAKFLEEKEGAK